MSLLHPEPPDNTYATGRLVSTLARWKDNLNKNKAVPTYLAYILQDDYEDRDGDNDEADYDADFVFDLTLKTPHTRDKIRAQVLQSACATPRRRKITLPLYRLSMPVSRRTW
jgi:hypothetical protein